MKYLFLIALTIGAFAQNYTAQDLLDDAYDKVERLSNPQLLFIGTAPDQDFDVFQTSFDLNTGTANFWMYAFGEEGDLSDLEIVPLTELPFLGLTDLRSLSSEIETDLLNEFAGLSDIPIPDGWLDSDVFASNLTQYSYFQTLRGQYSEVPMEFIGITAVDIDGELDVFWAIGYSNDEGEGFECYMSNLNQIIECEESEVNRVIDLMNIGAKVGPNPSKNYFTVEFQNIEQANNISMVDLLGNSIIPEFYLNSNKLFVETSNLEPGTYILNFEISNKVYTTRIVKF